MKGHNVLPPLERLAGVLKIDPTSPSGLRWKVSVNSCARANDIAGTLSKRGYWLVKSNGRMYLNHRIVWVLANGIDPGNSEVDHIDGNRSNNHPNNLRLATKSQNQRNRVGRQSNNTSGVPGVYWDKGIQKWRVRIRTCNKVLHLGCFTCKQEATKARREAELKYFGEFAPLRPQ